MDFHFNGRYINYLSFELELKFLFLIQEPSGVKKKKIKLKNLTLPYMCSKHFGLCQWLSG